MFKLIRRTPTGAGDFIRSFGTTTVLNSGHSKWASIKHDKARTDSARNKIAAKFANKITSCVKQGGVDANAELVTILELAKKNNVQRKLIDNAIKRGTGVLEKGGVASDSVTYEAMLPGGIAFIVEALTDNKNRTVAEVKAPFTKHGGSLSPAMFMFERRGYITLEMGDKTYDEIFEEVVELGAEDLEELPEEQGKKYVEIVTAPAEAGRLANELTAKKYILKEVSVVYTPNEEMMIETTDEDTLKMFNKVMAMLDDNSDITDVYHNLKVDEE